jgi:hypothetical protein
LLLNFAYSSPGPSTASYFFIFFCAVERGERRGDAAAVGQVADNSKSMRLKSEFVQNLSTALATTPISPTS